MNPSWYPDPFSDGSLRWWDGATWTAYTAPMGMPPAGFHAADPQADLDGELLAARRAMVTVVVSAIISAGWGLAFALAYGGDVSKEFDRIRTSNGSGSGFATGTSAGELISSWLLAFANWGLLVFFMIWLYRAADLARNAGLFARRNPVWAILGFIVPIVNFWFPYQVARDSLPYDDPRRRFAARWWTWYLLSTGLEVAVVFTDIFSAAVGIVVAAVAAVAFGLAAWYARRMIAAIGAAHIDLVGELSQPVTAV